MAIWRWPATVPPEDLGAVVHGPVLLARGPGVGAGLRHVVAHPGCLVLTLAVRARDVWAEAAGRQSGFWTTAPGEVDDAPVGSDPQVRIGVGDRCGIADPFGMTSTGGFDAYSLRATYVIAALPADGVLRVVLSWPHVGLPETTTDLQLTGLEDLDTSVVALLT